MKSLCPPGRLSVRRRRREAVAAEAAAAEGDLGLVELISLVEPPALVGLSDGAARGRAALVVLQ